jgi:hypothetical protein
MDLSSIFSIIASITAIVVNLYTIFTVRKHIGQIAKQGVEKVKDKIDKII